VSRMHDTVQHGAIVVLAAGRSSRLGSPKQLLAFKGKTLLQHAVDAALQTTLRPVVVVVGANGDTMKKEMEGMEVAVVDNTSWPEGIASSLRCGLTAVQKMKPNVDGIIFMVCDQPYVSASLLNDLINKQRETGKPIVTSNYGEAVGPPSLFYKSLFPELLQLRGDTGARRIIQQHEGEVVTVRFPKGSIDIDTLSDYDTLKKIDSPNT
jgi:molybdenum cofactor cytidylyltransferase